MSTMKQKLSNIDNYLQETYLQAEVVTRIVTEIEDSLNQSGLTIPYTYNCPEGFLYWKKTDRKKKPFRICVRKNGGDPTVLASAPADIRIEFRDYLDKFLDALIDAVKEKAKEAK